MSSGRFIYRKNYDFLKNILDISDEQFGHVIETFIYNEMIKNNIDNINFYNNTKIKKEVDFVITNNKKIIPIEVKISDRINKARLKNLVYFMENNRISNGILIYGGEEIKTIKIGKLKIDCLPYFII